jgi:prophage maintenance system killer protein
MNLDEPKFLTLAEVLYLHDESLARFDGSAGIREPGLIESALGSAQNTFWYGGGNLVFAKERHSISERRWFALPCHD